MAEQIEINKKSNSSESGIGDVFRLLGEPGRFLRANLFVIWLLIMFLVWMFTPIQGMPYPGEVWEAFQRMFALQDSNNLVYNTWVTLKLNIVGLFFASIISFRLLTKSRLDK